METDTGAVSGFSTVAPNASKLPHVVEQTPPKIVMQAVLLGMPLLAFLFGGCLLVSASTSPGTFLFASVFFFGALLLAFQLTRLRVPQAIFYPDRVEKPGLFRSAVLYRTQLRGIVRSRSATYFDILSTSSRETVIRLDASLLADPIVADWLRGAPDPRTEAREEDRARLLADPRYGETEADRARRLQRATQWVNALLLGCLPLFVWMWFAPFNTTSLLLSAAPLVVAGGLIGTSRGLVIWFARWGVRPRVAGAILPAFALALRAAFTVRMLEYAPLIVPAVVIGLAVAVTAYSRSIGAPSRTPIAAGLGILSAATFYGYAVALDVCLDTSAPSIFEATVVGEHAQYGRQTTFYLDLSPWFDRPVGEVIVSPGLYSASSVGSPICVTRRSGALGLAWARLALCSASFFLWPEHSGWTHLE